MAQTPGSPMPWTFARHFNDPKFSDCTIELVKAPGAYLPEMRAFINCTGISKPCNQTIPVLRRGTHIRELPALASPFHSIFHLSPSCDQLSLTTYFGSHLASDSTLENGSGDAPRKRTKSVITTLHASKLLLCAQSEYFRALFESGFKEADQKSVWRRYCLSFRKRPSPTCSHR
jgi:hypothetical protein